MQSELDELRRYEANARKNPKSLGASKLSTAVRNHQIRSLENKISKTSKNNSKSLSKASKPKQKKKSKHYVRNTLLVAGGIGIAALATNEDVKFAVSLGKDVIDAMKSEIKIEKAFYKAHLEALKKLATM